jgi:hypothetical protein
MLNEGNQIHNFISSSGSETVINYGSNFSTSYGSGSGSTGQKVLVPTVPVPQPCSRQFNFFCLRATRRSFRKLDSYILQLLTCRSRCGTVRVWISWGGLLPGEPRPSPQLPGAGGQSGSHPQNGRKCHKLSTCTGTDPPFLFLMDPVTFWHGSGSAPLTYGFGTGSVSCFFRLWLIRWQQKISLDQSSKSRLRIVEIKFFLTFFACLSGWEAQKHTEPTDPQLWF